MDADALYGILALIIAIVLHELAHGTVAYWLGDNTAKAQGRLTLNPLKHIDQFGSILLPGLLYLTKAPFLFGWAKPVPINPMALRWNGVAHPRQLMALVAVAGPAMNFVLAILAGLALYSGVWLEFWFDFLAINLLIGLFNLIPLPPMDGGRIAVGLLPLPLARVLARTERYGILLVAGLLFVLPLVLTQFGVNFDPFQETIGRVMPVAARVVLQITGHTLGN